MNRILALQGLSAVSVPVEVAESGESNYCSSETTACSTQSNHCKGFAASLAW